MKCCRSLNGSSSNILIMNFHTLNLTLRRRRKNLIKSSMKIRSCQKPTNNSRLRKWIKRKIFSTNIKVKSITKRIKCWKIWLRKKKKLSMIFAKACFKKKDSKLFLNCVPKTKPKTKNTLPLSTIFFKTSKRWSTSKRTTWSQFLRN